MSKRTLRVVSGTRAGTLVDIAGEVVIGREDVDLELADEQASRRHTAVRPVDGGIEVEDLGSLNGTFVDGERLAGAVTVSTAAVLRVGETEMALEIEQPAPAHEATVIREVPIPSVGDLTVTRPVMNGPVTEVTRAREIPAPDATRARPVATPDATLVRDVPRAPEVPAPDASAPSSPEAPPRSGPPVILIGILVAIVVAAVLVLLLLG